MAASIMDRVISLGPDLPAIPERLLLAQARGQVLFIVGAGVSRSAGLPDFRDLVIQVYEEIDEVVYAKLSTIPDNVTSARPEDISGLVHQQAAEVRRFINRDYDVCLGMLERRIEGRTHGDSVVRTAIGRCLRRAGKQPAPIHRAIMRLADRGGSTTVVTTNFEHLLEAATPRGNGPIQTYSLGGIPRPEGLIVPFDLPDALAQIHSVAPGLASNRSFRRLSTLVRSV